MSFHPEVLGFRHAAFLKVHALDDYLNEPHVLLEEALWFPPALQSPFLVPASDRFDGVHGVAAN